MLLDWKVLPNQLRSLKFSFLDSISIAMAGKRQHYIPQFLQRGFLDESNGSAERTWLHRLNKAPRLVGIRDIGVSEHLYSRQSIDNSPSSDDKITEAETAIDVALKTLRTSSVNARIDSSIASEVVLHLTFRAKYVRAAMTQGLMLIADHTASLVESSDRLRQQLGIDNPSFSTRTNDLIATAMASVPIQQRSVAPALLERLMAFLVRENFESLFADSEPRILAIVSELRSGLRTVIADAHTKVVLDADFLQRRERLCSLNWTVMETQGAILPDCVSISREDSNEYIPLLLSDPKKTDRTILPISHNRLLVGVKDVQTSLDLSEINEASAICSSDFFISKKSSDGAGLNDRIGKRLSDTISEQVLIAIDEVTFSKSERPEEKSGQVTDADIAYGPPQRLSITLSGYGDEPTAVRIGNVLAAIVREVSRNLPLATLDGVTFAIDYPAALAQLDRGSQTLLPEISEKRDYGLAVAKCVSVIRDNQQKKHIVFDASIASLLLYPEHEEHLQALHMIVEMLGHVGHDAKYGEKFAREENILTDQLAKLLFRTVSPAPGMYFVARQSASVMPMAGNRFAALAFDSYKNAIHEARLARSAFRTDGNVDDMIDKVLPHVKFVLEHCAQWLGHRDGLPAQDNFPGVSLVNDLKEYQLNLWIDLLGRDLRCLYAENHGFSSKKIYALTRHAERLLWTLLIFPWPMESGLAYITVADELTQ